jgi:hypothetical protein
VLEESDNLIDTQWDALAKDIADINGIIHGKLLDQFKKEGSIIELTQ